MENFNISIFITSIIVLFGLLVFYKIINNPSEKRNQPNPNPGIQNQFTDSQQTIDQIHQQNLMNQTITDQQNTHNLLNQTMNDHQNIQNTIDPQPQQSFTDN